MNLQRFDQTTRDYRFCVEKGLERGFDDISRDNCVKLPSTISYKLAQHLDYKLDWISDGGGLLFWVDIFFLLLL